ncbi:MAG TPA: VacJ family lipoprotein [Rhodopila sp.]|uniref:MlaA family lipoprotein n=1 Tax=Rhodopila sp. TaxID=2480087 RepID=UPI002C2560CD|nr:VacJ family lipoprotein [Rhodopila sp.]HVY17502.1 VacJ family lipoprotein [Rhodopila sp.]
MRSVRPTRPPRAGAPRRLFCLLALGVLLAGCATKPPASDPDALADYEQTNDPLEPTNRVFYAINNGLDTVILRPLALGYRYAVPEPVRNGIHNMLSNLGTPVQLANDMMEGKPRRAGDTVMRFVINTTVGVVGFFDVATKWGYPNHDADFGMTLASWGVPEGPFLFLPILGPSDPRDAAGFGVDIALDPFTWVGNPRDSTITALNWTRFGLNAIDTRERVEDSLQSIKKTALDPYATFRSLYRQHRHAQIEQLLNDKRATAPAWDLQSTDQPAK